MLALIGPVVTWLIANGPQLAAAGISTYKMIMAVKQTYDDNRVVGDPQWDALEAQITELHAGALRDTSRDV